MATLKPQTPLSVSDLIKTLGDSGSERYSGYFQDEPNTQWRDETRIDIVEDMRRSDGAVKGVLNAIKAPMLSTQWYIEIASDDPKDQEIKNFVQDNIDTMQRTWKDFLREALAYLDFGHYCFEKVYEKRDGKIYLRDLEPRIPASIQNWQLDDGRRGIVQQINTDESTIATAEIPADKLLVLTNDKEGDDLTGQSVLRPAWKHYYIKDVLYKVASISAERYGVGIPKITMPDGAGDDEKAEAEEMARNIRSHEEARIIVPNANWIVEIVTPSGNPEGSAIESQIQHHNKMILLSVLAGFLGLGTDGVGSFALSKDQSSFFLKHVEDKASYLAEQFTKQVITQLVEINFGPREVMPQLRFVSLGDVDFKEMSEVLNTLKTSGLIKNSGKMTKFVHDTFKLPELTEDELDEVDDSPEKPEIEEPEVPEEVPEKDPEEDPVDESKEEMHEHLAQKKSLKIYRDLTLQEKRVDFKYLNNEFNEEEDALKTALVIVVAADLQNAIKRAMGKLKAGDLKGVADIAFVNRNKIKSVVKESMKVAYETGKKSASGEMDVPKPPTPSIDTQTLDFEAGQIADAFAGGVDVAAKTVAKEGYSKEVAIAAIGIAMHEIAKNQASRMITNASGTAVGEYVNKGRRAVFNKNSFNIKAYQRSEILDNKTCAMCMSLDQRVVRADDPMAKMDLVHTNCRGIWVPIMGGESYKGSLGLPKTITDRIETIGGVPAVNSFTQLKKPINRSNEAVQDEIKRRLKD
jgi:hypothetical protein